MSIDPLRSEPAKADGQEGGRCSDSDADSGASRDHTADAEHPEMLSIQPHKALALDPKVFVALCNEINEVPLSDHVSTTKVMPAGLPCEVDFMEEGHVQHWNLHEIR